jgi:hypothetical protein
MSRTGMAVAAKAGNQEEPSETRRGLGKVG